LKELPRNDWVIPGDELKVRRDMRSHRTMSIDPPGCTDVDDAVSVRRVRLPPGGDVNGGGVKQKHMGSQTQTGKYEYVDDSPESNCPYEEFGYEVAVHIADVSHFVEEGSVLDLEARARGTTVYLTDGRIDMLPAVLSENLCSLIGGADR
jgi:exoribonuclease R